MDIFFPSYCTAASNSSVYSSFSEVKKDSVNGNSELQHDAISNIQYCQKPLFVESFNQHFCRHGISCKVCEASKDLTSADIQNKLKIHKMVQDSGKYNYEGCRVRVNDKINVTFMRTMLANYNDLQVCDFLEFGFPLGFEGSSENLHSKDQIWKYKNHKGATEFP